MNAQELFQAGRLQEAVQALGAELRDNPGDAQRRTFLFELLCFSGEFERAQKHLDVLAGQGGEAEMGALLYRAVLHAEGLRNEMFTKGTFPLAPPEKALSGTLNGAPFDDLFDADPRIGARLEVFAAGDYLWIPFEHIASIEVRAPQRLRDLLWAPALVQTGPAFEGKELGEVLLPVLTPLAWKHPDNAVRLGRSTEWQEDQAGLALPAGQKVFLVDDEEFPILEVRKLEFAGGPADS